MPTKKQEYEDDFFKIAYTVPQNEKLSNALFLKISIISCGMTILYESSSNPLHLRGERKMAKNCYFISSLHLCVSETNW